MSSIPEWSEGRILNSGELFNNTPSVEKVTPKGIRRVPLCTKYVSRENVNQLHDVANMAATDCLPRNQRVYDTVCSQAGRLLGMFHEQS